MITLLGPGKPRSIAAKKIVPEAEYPQFNLVKRNNVSSTIFPTLVGFFDLLVVSSINKSQRQTVVLRLYICQHDVKVPFTGSLQRLS